MHYNKLEKMHLKFYQSIYLPEAFAQAFEVFDSNRPLVVISEGLINYFDKDFLKQLIQSIAHYGASFKKLHYLTDLYPEPVKNKLASLSGTVVNYLNLCLEAHLVFYFLRLH